MKERPRWRLADAIFETGCVRAQALVRKSGKQGFALAIQLRSRRGSSAADRSPGSSPGDGADGTRPWSPGDGPRGTDDRGSSAASAGGACSFSIAASRLIFAHGPTVIPGGTLSVPQPAASTSVAARPQAVIALPGRSQLYAWLPVEFDNNAAWNAGRVDATLELDVSVAGAAASTWRIAMSQR